MGVQILGTIHFFFQEQNIKGFFLIKCKLFKCDMTSKITVQYTTAKVRKLNPTKKCVLNTLVRTF